MENPWLGERFGFAQGFEVYDDSFAAWGGSGDAAVDAAIDWLEGLAPGERFDRVKARHSSSRSQQAYQVMSAALPQAVADYQAPDKENAPVSPELESRLEALGYLED